MLLSDILRLKFPNEFRRLEIQVGDHGQGNGPEIVLWPEDWIFPTEEDLLSWKDEISDNYQIEKFAEVNKEILSQLEILDLKSIRALRIKDDNKLQALEEEAMLLRKQLIKDFNDS